MLHKSTSKTFLKSYATTDVLEVGILDTRFGYHFNSQNFAQHCTVGYNGTPFCLIPDGTMIFLKLQSCIGMVGENSLNMYSYTQSFYNVLPFF